MHNIDRTQLESGFDAFEFEGESEVWPKTDTESPFSEAEEMELAAELLGVTNEAELNQFLGDLIKRGAQAVGGIIRSPVGQALGNYLKGAARQGLPMLGRAVGTYFGGPAGGQMGAQAASTAGKLFGLELEGLSQEDQEFEVARRIVRFGGAAASRAARSGPAVSPQTAARRGAIQAAQLHAPGLLRGKRPRPPRPGPPVPIRQSFHGGYFPDNGADIPVHTGRWIRRDPGIVILNCYGAAPSTQPSMGEPSPQGDGGDEGVGSD
jgi:hypothetical protein